MLCIISYLSASVMISFHDYNLVISLKESRISIINVLYVGSMWVLCEFYVGFMCLARVSIIYIMLLFSS